MEKNPISFLQEYMMINKRKTPVYTVESSITGTHINTFVMKVTCGELSAEGIGASKKEAKTNAALKLLDILKLKTNNRQSVSRLNNNSMDFSLNNSIDSSLNGSMNSSLNNCMDSSLNNNNLPTSSLSTGINYIGQLQEHAGSVTSSFPDYIIDSVFGPQHNPVFTCICKYKNLQEKATGKTKKEAKHQAAKQMYERLGMKKETNVIVPEIKIRSYLDSTVTDGISNLKVSKNNETIMQESIDKAKEQYSQLSKVSVNKGSVNKDRSFDEYHTFLRDNYSDKERGLVVDKLQDTIKSCQNCISLKDENIKPMPMLKSALKILNLNVKEVTYPKQKEFALHGLELETKPIIFEIGHAQTKKEAEILAIITMARTLTIMLL